MGEHNCDYAHTLFAECVTADPSRLSYVEALLRNLCAKHPIPKTHSLFSFGRRRAFKRVVVDRQWQEAIRLGIDLLAENPWDVTTLEMLADISRKLGYNEIELAYLRQALDANPRSISVNEHCARSLARMGQFDQAIACWHRIETLQPRNNEAKEMIRCLSEEKQKYSLERLSTAPKKAASADVEALATPTTRELEPVQGARQRALVSIKADPYTALNYLKLADLMAESDEFSEAVGLLQQGIEMCGQQDALNERLERYRELMGKAKLAQIEKRESYRQSQAARVPWLEAILLVAVCTLLLQLFPSLGLAAQRVLNVRQWSRSTWFAANVLLLLFLCILYYGPSFRGILRSRKMRHATRLRR